jgi:hypothetical protein
MPIILDDTRIDTFTESLTSLFDEFPERVYLLKHPSTGKYGCYCYDGLHGLAVFSSEAGAFRFAEWIDLSGMVSEEVSFDEAREIARSRPAPLMALLLLDSLQNPKVHYIK